MFGLGISLGLGLRRQMFVPPVLANLLLDGKNNLTCFSMKKRITSYTGAALELYNPDTESYLDIPYASNGDLDVLMAATFLDGAVGKVRRFYSQNNGVVATQLNTTLMPEFSLDGLNGEPTILFNGLAFFQGSLPFVGATLTAYAVGTLAGSNQGRLISVFTPGGEDYGSLSSAAFLLRHLGNDAIASYRGSYQGNIAIPLNTPKLMSVSYTATNFTIGVNTTYSTTSGANSNFNFTDLRIGRSPDGNGWGGKMSDLIMTSDPIDSEISSTLINDFGLT